MRGPFILAIDQGTTSSRALVVDRAGSIAGLGQVPFAQHYPQPGWVEHDPGEIWSSTRHAIRDALAAAAIATSDLAAIGIANQRETLVVWDRASSEPVGPAIVWQDRRSAGICDELRNAGHEETFASRTGLTLDPYFTGTKLTWLLRSRPELVRAAERGELAAGTVDSWLVWKLTGGRRHVTDYTNASRTLLFNIRRGTWDDTLAGLLGAPLEMLPAQLPSRAHFGTTDADVFGSAVPITGVAGDQQAAFFGQVCNLPGQAKNTYGTGAFLLAQAGPRPVTSRNRLLTSLGPSATATQPEYVLEGSVFIAGAAVQWLRDELHIVSDSAEIETLAASVPDTGGVTFVPAFSGLGAPHWDPDARGALLGLTRGTTAAHIARAALEAIALSSVDLIDAMSRDLGSPISELRVDGGASRNNLLMQMQADVAGIPVIRPMNTETTAMGAAFLAGIEAGVWANEDEVAALWTPDCTFEPTMAQDEREQRRLVWRRAVERARGWATAS